MSLAAEPSVIASVPPPVIASEAKQSLADVLTEELGHYIDSEVNEEDTPGDEGEYFAALVSGDELSEEEIERLRGEDDTVAILDGLVVVEASSKLTFKTTNFPAGDEPIGIAAADFDKDGFQDIVVGSATENSVSVFFGDGKGGALTSLLFPVKTEPIHVAVGDFNRDRNPDILTANYADDSVAVLLGDGKGRFSSSSTFRVGDNPLKFAVGDVNRDGKLDTVAPSLFSDNVSVLLGNGNGTFDRAVNFPVGHNATEQIVLKDVDGDKNLDILASNNDSGNISVLLGNGDGSFGSPTKFGTGGSKAVGVAVKDLNRDGKLDLVVPTLDPDGISVMLGTGNGVFGFPDRLEVEEMPEHVVIEDVNGDRKLDIVVTNRNSQSVSVLLGRGKGRFEPAMNFDVEDTPRNVIVEDLNGDGKLDIAVTNQGSDTISILLNTTKTGTTNPKIAISDTNIVEGNKGRKNAKFAVTLDSESDETVKVNYATANGTAKAGKDYRKTNGTLTFKPGQTRKTVNVPVFGDTLEEGNEKFNLNLSKPRNAKFGDRRGIGTIRDNDKVVPQLSIGDARVTEGDDGRKQAKFTVTLNAKSKDTVRVNYVTGNGTADAGEDYRRTNGSLTFKPGQRRKTITVPVFGDIMNEKNEKFQVTLRKPRNAELGDRRGIGTIRDND